MQHIVDKALALVTDGMTLGLGTGRAATAFIEGLGRHVASGLRVRGVPTSDASAELARKLNIPLVTLEDVAELDIAFDGADEVDPQLNLIKGYGGALVREKIVAASARRFVVLVTPEKLVARLGARGRLPVEVVPFAVPLCRRALGKMGLAPEVRVQGAEPFITDNGNVILDCRCQGLPDPDGVELAIRRLPGVVGTGLFLNMAHTVLVQEADRAVEKSRP